MISAIAIDDEPLALTVIESLCEKNDQVSLQQTFTSPNDALKYLQKYPVNLIFCDIHMPAMTGINFVKSLTQQKVVIFTTAFSQYAAASYELNAIDYLLKPINAKRFNQAVNKAREYLNYTLKNEHLSEKHLFVRADFSLIKIAFDDILYIEGLADYLKIHVKDRKTIVARMSMKAMVDKLPASAFIRVHRSYILPIHKIEAIKGTMILIDGQEFPIGRTYADDFFKRFPTGI